jgi:ubiquinone/menaquinone biosynthesis C-methylase UbiE
VIRSGSLEFALQDARSLPYTDNTFQRITVISTIEHVPENGDIAVARELGRVLALGGRIVYTMPYGQHFFAGQAPYSTSTTQRIYDNNALTERLVAPSGLKEIARFYLVDRWFDFEYAVWRRVPNQLHNLTGWTGLGDTLCQDILRDSTDV